jgi:hypothetical protein
VFSFLFLFVQPPAYLEGGRCLPQVHVDSFVSIQGLRDSVPQPAKVRQLVAQDYLM